MALEPSGLEIGYQDGSSYLICSDGVTDMLSDEEIQAVLTKNSTAEEKVEELLGAALEKGGRDNVTMVLAQISGYEKKILSKDGQSGIAPGGNNTGLTVLPGSNKRDKENLR